MEHWTISLLILYDNLLAVAMYVFAAYLDLHLKIFMLVQYYNYLRVNCSDRNTFSYMKVY